MVKAGKSERICTSMELEKGSQNCYVFTVYIRAEGPPANKILSLSTWGLEIYSHNQNPNCGKCLQKMR